MEDIIECEVCGGDAYLMGTLGYTSHYRCRSCGMDTEVESGSCEFGMHEEDYNDDHLSDYDRAYEDIVDVMWDPERNRY